MISKRTLFSFLFALALALGLYVWASGVRDDCDRLSTGSTTSLPSVMVQSGTRTITVPCGRWTWVVRQNEPVQALVLFNAILGLVFFWSSISDWVRWRGRHMQGGV